MNVSETLAPLVFIETAFPGEFFPLEGVVAPWYYPLTLQPEQSGGMGSNTGRAPLLEFHDKGSRQWRKLWGGGVGEKLPPPQFNKTRKFSVEVGNFEGGIETAMKKRVTVEKERVSILNEQTKCSRSTCIIFFKFLCTNIHFKTRRK